MIILPYAFIVAGVGLIESLLTLNLIDEITETRGKSNKEAVAQGMANCVTGFFSGMGGCAMIGQSLINISSGARTHLWHCCFMYVAYLHHVWRKLYRTNANSGASRINDHGSHWNL